MFLPEMKFSRRIIMKSKGLGVVRTSPFLTKSSQRKTFISGFVVVTITNQKGI